MSHPDFPFSFTNPLPLEAVLPMLKFMPTDKGYVRKWNDLEFVACESIGCWFLIRDGYCTKREAWPPHEIRIFSPISPMELMATIYKLWAAVYRNKETLDPLLIWAKEWVDYQHEIKALIPPPPTIWAEREFLRHCFNHIERMHDWIDTDYDICFSQTRGQLRINAKNMELYCPAHGNLLGETVVSAKDLFHRLPKRFSGQVVMLQINGDKLIIDRHVIPAHWDEGDVALDINLATNPGNK